MKRSAADRDGARSTGARTGQAAGCPTGRGDPRRPETSTPLTEQRRQHVLKPFPRPRRPSWPPERSPRRRRDLDGAGPALAPAGPQPAAVVPARHRGRVGGRRASPATAQRVAEQREAIDETPVRRGRHRYTLRSIDGACRPTNLRLTVIVSSFPATVRPFATARLHPRQDRCCAGDRNDDTVAHWGESVVASGRARQP